MNPHRYTLLDIYQAALGAVAGRARVREWLLAHELHGPLHVAAVGKAAAAMMLGAFDVSPGRIAQALVITKEGHGAGLEGLPVEVVESAHPLPDGRSLAAGERLLRFVVEAPPEAHFLFLISGGASALVEALPEGMSPEVWQRANAWLLSSGLDIHALNAVRKGLSRIKGGRLIPLLAGREAVALLISDVRGDEPTVIGSGLLSVDAHPPRLPPVPEWLAELVTRAPPAPSADDPVCERLRVSVVARLDEAKRAAAARAAEHGFPVRLHEGYLHGDAEVMGHDLAAFLASASPGVHVWGGETTVTLPATPGRGGRCQHLALAAALDLQHRSDVLLLAAGSDGGDGPGEDAGALVDGATVERGEVHCLSARRYLDHADSGTFLEAAGDLLLTGPTGTNVGDLVIALKG